MDQTKIIAIIFFIGVAFSTPKAQQYGDPNVSPNQSDFLASFIKSERRVRGLLNQYTFKREVVLQTLGANGQVTGEYIRHSQFLFDDQGNRLEQVTYHPPSTIREMRITKEDVQDLASAQLLGIDVSEIGKYRLTFAGEETLDGKRVYVLTVEPAIKPDPYRMRNRFFVGHVWIDAESFQMVKVKGVVQPQGKQRFPVFETWREAIGGGLRLPTRTEADDVLRFPKRNVNYRMRVRYYDYKIFAAKLKITEIDEPEVTLERCTKNYNAPPVNSYYWPPDTEVRIYSQRGMFSAEEHGVLLATIRDWAEIARQGATGVTFVHAGEFDGVLNCANCLGITRREVHRLDPKIYARFYPLKLDQDGLLISARIDLDFATTHPAALQSLLAHELGHGMGLSDCRKCEKNKTIMNPFPGIDRDNGLTAASDCDIEVVKEIYELQRRIDKNLTRGTCNVGKSAPAFGFWMWAPGSTIKLYVLGADFAADELPYLRLAVQNWNAVAAAAGSRVKFDYAGSTLAPLYCENCLTVMRGPVFDRVKRHAAELQAYSARGDQILTWAHIVVDPALTNPRAVTNAIAHEIGHTFGLLDCYRCKSNSTVMNKFKKFNQPNNMEGPTPCDIAQVNAAYKGLAVRVDRAPVKLEIADEGEEPIDDDTPVIIRKP